MDKRKITFELRAEANMENGEVMIEHMEIDGSAHAFIFALVTVFNSLSKESKTGFDFADAMRDALDILEVEDPDEPECN